VKLGATSARWAPVQSAPSVFAFVSALVEVEKLAISLDADELPATIFIFLGAGHETTVTLIDNGTLALLNIPNRWAGT
jgi:cytochrome P450